MNNYIIEDGYNTSYIDSLFVAMFNSPSYIQVILTNYPIDEKNLYLQELINIFVYYIRTNKIVTSELLNKIRNFSYLCGFQNNNITDLHNPLEYYLFINTNFNNNDIIFSSKNELKQIKYINFIITDITSIKNELYKWINQYNNFTFIKEAYFIPFFLKKEQNHLQVDINKYIKFPNNTWYQIHSIICYSYNGNKQFYSIVYNKNKWYIFSGNSLRSLNTIDLKNEDEANKIKQECIMLFYTLIK